MLWTVRYYKEHLEELEAFNLSEAEARARNLALSHKWTLLSVSRADDPRPAPGEGTWKFPEFGIKK